MATKAIKGFNEKDLNEKDRKHFVFVKERIQTLQQTRKDHYGVNLDELWAEADKNSVPHRLKTKGKKMVVTDEDRGWRGALVELGSSQWQSDISQSNPFVKIQTAIAILIDQNPTGVLTAASKKYQATTEIMKQLYARSWEYAKSKAQLRMFTFNLAKYGWAIGRTYPLKIVRTVTDVVTGEQKEVVEYNDVYRENLDPRNCWIDDLALPNSPMTVRDWSWRKVYDIEDFKEEFKDTEAVKNDWVEPGGNTTETISTDNKAGTKKTEGKNLVEVLFYENRVKDLFMIVANGVPVLIEPLPISDVKGLKKLSCWQTYWNLRHASSPYGVGIYEAIRYDQSMLDRVRNMTIDQLTMSIYKMFFYQGTQSLTETGDIKITPGVGKQVLDPKNITWLEVPGPGQDAYTGIEMMRRDLDEASGITDPLLGQITGKTAFEIAQAKESALKRLKNPLENIQEALNQEGYITLSLIQLLYSIPETYSISDPALIDDYLKEIDGDTDLYSREPVLGEDGNPAIDEMGLPQEQFTAKVYPEFALNLKADEKGNLTETEETRFFRVKPETVSWEGTITIKSQSLLTPSKQIDKALDLEMYNLLIPLFAQPPELYKKAAESICKLYDKDPRDILPDNWIRPPQQPLFVGADQLTAPGGPSEAPGEAQKVTAQPTLPSQPAGVAGQLMNQISPRWSTRLTDNRLGTFSVLPSGSPRTN